MRRNKYVLARGVYAAAGKSSVHTQVVGLDRSTNEELLLKHIRESGEQGVLSKELEQVLPGLDRRQIQRLTYELRDEMKPHLLCGKDKFCKVVCEDIRLRTEETCTKLAPNLHQFKRC